MSTTYVRFIQSYEDPVWGTQAIDWIHTDLIRVYRNAQRRAVFEWVGNASIPFDLEQVRKHYPLCVYAPEGAESSRVEYRRAIPFPDRVHPAK